MARTVVGADDSSRRRQAILFNPLDLHKALTRMERSVVPPDKIEVARVRASEARNGRARVRNGPEVKSAKALFLRKSDPDCFLTAAEPSGPSAHQAF